MKMTRLYKTAKTLMWAVVLVGLIPCGSYTALANPGLTPSASGKTAYVDFSNFPSGSTIRHDLVSWQAQGWSDGARCLQLVRMGGYLEVVVGLPENVSTARLAITHRSAYAPGCMDSGFAPVTTTINGSTLTQYYSPPAGVPGSTGFTTDRWNVTGWLVPGRNCVRITAGTLCSVYEVQRLEISITATTSRLIEDYQMTHNIDGLRPIDSTTIFTPNDHRAVCWTKVTSEAIGQRIEWRFYDPSGALYYQGQRRADRYNWGYIGVANRRPSDLPGQWRVDIYIAGRFQVSVPFTIGTMRCSVNAPRVTGIEFPSVILADGGKITSYVSFFDPNGDITSVRFDVVNAVRFTPFSFEPDISGKTSGSFSFRIWATIRQNVTLKVTLIDRLGNKSEPYYFSFRAI
ncbi:hypothetical protein KAU37_01260 [Candidatus Bipolaricaulota bacterium]|nr:hypothetical protein [Candidatus Bipolaricaulota bacterium]